MKNTMIWQIGEFFCPHSCLSCGKAGGILCECCEKYIIDDKNMGCLRCGNTLKNGVCLKCSLPFSQQFCLGFRDGILRQLVSLFKYQSVRACGVELVRLYKMRFSELDDDLVIVPLPTIRKHIRERGLDHTFKIARWLTNMCGGHVERTLVRANNTVQVGANESERIKQAQTAYRAREVDHRKKYMLLDDVWTTGSSMLAACAEMQKAGANNISVIVLTKSG